MRTAKTALLCSLIVLLSGCHTMRYASGPNQDLSTVLTGIRTELAEFKAGGDPSTDLCLQDVQVVLKVTAEKGAGGTAGATLLKFSADVSGSLENTVTLTFTAPEAKKNAPCSSVVMLRPKPLQ